MDGTARYDGTKVGGPVVRRPVAWVVAVVLLVEALAVVLVNWILAELVDRQHMSLADLDSGTMSTASKAAGLVIGLYLALCGAVALRAAFRDRSPAGFGRGLLISVAVVHGFLAAAGLALVSWRAFVFMVVVLGLVVLLLMTHDHEERAGGEGSPAGGGGSPAAPVGGGGSPVAPVGGVTPPAAPTGP